MFIAVNISSVEIEFALIDNKADIVSKFSISTENKKTEDQYITEIKNVFDCLQVNTNEITHAALLSNAPKFNKILSSFFTTYIKINPIIIKHQDITLKCSHDIDKTKIPIDILAGTYACNKKYGSNIIFINFDTIISFGVCINNEFLGYVIYPGLDLLSNAVHSQVPEYPEIIIEPTKKSFAHERYESLSVGIFNGVIGACDTIIQNILSDYPNKEFRVVATCKKPELLQYSSKINIIDPDLRIKGIIESAKNQLFAI